MNTIGFYLLLGLLLFGVNTAIWTVIGAVRWFSELVRAESRRTRLPQDHRVIPNLADVAVLMAAHNEEAVIQASIASASRLVPRAHIFVVSDGSTDRTVAVARAAGANVLDLQPNRGKAGALAAGVDQFRLPDRFEIVMILDADTEPDSDYLSTGLPLFADSEVVVVAGRATTQWRSGRLGPVGRILLAHRERIYVLVQRLVKYGQGHAAIDAITIAPGFASMYRSRALREIEMDPPALVIEDFNMTFEIHRRRLGRIAFHPDAAIARTQDPAHLREYARQVGRWSLGYWQTVRRHGLCHPGVFWLTIALYSVELIGASVCLLLTACVVVASAGLATVALIVGSAPAWPTWMPAATALLLVVAVPDLILSLAVAAGQRRLLFLAAAPVYPLLRVVDAWLCLFSLATSFRTTSNGRWISPTRRPTVTSEPAAG